MALPRAARHDGAVSFYKIAVIVIIVGSYLAWIRPDGLQGRFRAGRWGLLLPLVALAYASVSTAHHWLVIAEVLAGCLLMLLAPRASAKTVPFALLGLAFVGLVLARKYTDGHNESTLYGLVLAGSYSGRTALVLPEAVLFLAAGLWLLLRLNAPGSGLVRQTATRLWQSRSSGILPWQGFLVLLPVALILRMLDMHTSSGAAIDVAVIAVAVVLALRARLWAATLAAAASLVLGTYGILLAMYGHPTSGHYYGILAWESNRGIFIGSGIQGTLLLALGVWGTPRVLGQHLGLREKALAAKAELLTERVETLTQTRTDAVDTAAAELRRIERDLHDGAQARLVALGMSLRAAEKLFKTSPDAALALVSEAKETSSRALTDLRDLVRGIYPPVLADRGLADAVRALALDTPLHTVVDVDLPGEVDLPVGSAVYFAVAEILTNAAKHSGARTVRIHLSYAVGTLRVQVTDDGAGGADPAAGTGLTGVERRLATFDGILAVNSPPGGPTIVVIEVPCALSSPKTSSC